MNTRGNSDRQMLVGGERHGDIAQEWAVDRRGNSQMSALQTRHFAHLFLAPGGLAQALKKIVERFAAAPPSVKVSLTERLPDGTRVTRVMTEGLSSADIDLVCDLRGGEITTHFRCPDDTYASIMLSGELEVMTVAASCESATDLAQIFEILQTELSLTAAEFPLEAVQRSLGAAEEAEPVRWADILARVSALEETVFAQSRRMRGFLSYRFTPTTEALLSPLKEFFALLNVDVVTGGNYEPRRISDKVLDRLRGPLDLIVLLVTRDGESFWTRDEIVAGHLRGIAVIPIVEEGVEFTQGIFGDLEYIPFAPGHIGDAFLKLLEAVKYIRQLQPQVSPVAPTAERG
jgi:hypothetical protein